jgi:hypothetical protein
MRRTHSLTIAVVLFSISLLPGTAPAQEHPAEHPAEHPEEKAETEVTVDQLADAIVAYVEQDAKLKGGFFLVYDIEAKRPLVLTLDKVHKDKLATLGDGLYFACADFKTPEGKVYDLDVFMMEGAEGLQPTEVTVHKEEGKPRYGWVEKDGIWKREPIKK